MWTKDELEKIVDICARHDVLIVADEIHCDLTFFNHRYTSLLSLAPQVAQNCIVCKSASKTFNLAGINLAHLIIQSEHWRQRVEGFIKRNALNTFNIFAPEMVKAAYLESDDWYDQMRAYMENNIRFATNYINEHIPKISMLEQESTYLGFIDARELGLSPRELERLCEEKAKLALNYGHWFGEGGEGFLRMNLACPQSIIKEGLSRLKNAITPG